jgi:hypothetical protein
VKKNGFSPVIIILIIAILGVVGYLGYKNIFLTKNDIFSQVSSAISNTKNLDKSFIISLNTNNKGVMSWYTQDGYLITSPNSQEVVLEYNCDPGHGGNGENLNSVAPAIVNNVDATLNKNGFQRIDTTNAPETRVSNTSEIGKTSPYFIGFGMDNYVNEKLNLYCDLSVALDCGGGAAGEDTSFAHQNLSFTCTTKQNYDINYAQQIKPLSDMGLKGLTLDTLSSYNNYYLFNEHGAYGPGAYRVAELVNGKFISLFGGQDHPSCATVDQYKVPHQLGNGIDQCYDSSGTNAKLVNNPN